eukprot:g59895.t1
MHNFTELYQFLLMDGKKKLQNVRRCFTSFFWWMAKIKTVSLDLFYKYSYTFINRLQLFLNVRIFSFQGSAPSFLPPAVPSLAIWTFSLGPGSNWLGHRSPPSQLSSSPEEATKRPSCHNLRIVVLLSAVAVFVATQLFYNYYTWLEISTLRAVQLDMEHMYATRTQELYAAYGLNYNWGMEEDVTAERKGKQGSRGGGGGSGGSKNSWGYWGGGGSKGSGGYYPWYPLVEQCEIIQSLLARVTALETKTACIYATTSEPPCSFRVDVLDANTGTFNGNLLVKGDFTVIGFAVARGDLQVDSNIDVGGDAMLAGWNHVRDWIGRIQGSCGCSRLNRGTSGGAMSGVKLTGFANVMGTTTTTDLVVSGTTTLTATTVNGMLCVQGSASGNLETVKVLDKWVIKCLQLLRWAICSCSRE